MSRSAAVRKAAPEAGRRGRPARPNQAKSARATEVDTSPTEPDVDSSKKVAAAPAAGLAPEADGRTTDGPALTLVPPPTPSADAAPASAEVPAAAAADVAAAGPIVTTPVPAGEEAREPSAAGEAAAGEAEPALLAVADVSEELAVEQALPGEAEPAAPDEDETPSPVNYDEEGIGEVEIDGSIYRFDSGKQGTALCLSRRQEGAWRWSYLGELRWDGRDLRSKALERSLLTRLSASLRALAEAAS